MDSKTCKRELGRTYQTQADSDVETDRYQAPEVPLRTQGPQLEEKVTKVLQQLERRTAKGLSNKIFTLEECIDQVIE